MKDYHQLLARINRRSLQVVTKGKGMQSGRRKSHVYGTSLDFSDYKLYHPGDDIRQIDWNVYGRTNKPYVKRFLDEKEISVTILLDATSSMRQISTKWELAREIAASLSYMTLSHEDRLSFSAVATNFSFHRKGSIHNKRTFYELVEMKEPVVKESYTGSLFSFPFTKSQLVMLITDGLEPIPSFQEVFKRLTFGKQQVWLLQVLSQEEMNPSLSGDFQLVDSEVGTQVDVSLHPSTKNLYRKRLDEHNQQLSELCMNHGIRMSQVTDAQDIQSILLRELASFGLVK